MKFARGLMWASFGFAFAAIIVLVPEWWSASAILWCVAWCLCLFSYQAESQYRYNQKYEEDYWRAVHNTEKRSTWHNLDERV